GAVTHPVPFQPLVLGHASCQIFVRKARETLGIPVAPYKIGGAMRRAVSFWIYTTVLQRLHFTVRRAPRRVSARHGEACATSVHRQPSYNTNGSLLGENGGASYWSPPCRRPFRRSRSKLNGISSRTMKCANLTPTGGLPTTCR